MSFVRVPELTAQPSLQRYGSRHRTVRDRLVQEGQQIAEDDPLLEIATDKATVEIPSPAGGVVSKILVGEGEVVPVGTVLVVIGANGAAQPGVRRTAGCTIASAGLTRCARRRSCADLRSSLRRRSRKGLQVPARKAASPDAVPAVHRPRFRSAHPSERREPIRGVKRQMLEHLTRAHREYLRRSRGSRSASSPMSTRSGSSRWS